LVIPDHLVSRSLNLSFNVALALALPWLQWPRSILGMPSSYADLPRGIDSDLEAIDASAAGVGTLARGLLSLPVIGKLWRESSGPFEFEGEFEGRHPDQRWLFINGVCADRRVAELNARALSHMFQRPLTILHNATNGLIADLWESAVGKGFESISDAAASNMEPLVDALCDDSVKRVILISHSQGTIVASIMLKTLEEWMTPPEQVTSGPGAQKVSPERTAARKIAGTSASDAQPVESKGAEGKARACLRPELIAKLECYCFANCSTSMTPIAVVGTPPRHAPWIESYGNEFDAVARLGLLAPPHGIGSARIEGDRYRRDDTWGHLLNVHYLAPLHRELSRNPAESQLKPFRENLLRVPRLFEYYGGRSPEHAYP
jgi:hypothetical protein